MHFARVLRAAGLPVGPGKVLDAIRAVEAIGLDNRRDFYWTLHAVFVNRRDQRELFDQAFHIFWRKPDLLERAMQLLLPQIEAGVAPSEAELARRLAEALGPEKRPGQGEAEEETPVELDATLTFSPGEVLQRKDFEQMSADEVARAKALIRSMRLPIRAVPTRRFRPEPRGRRVDLRRTLRQSLRGGGAMIDLARKRRVRRHPPLVILCDISGSMERYSRMLLHFMHAVTNDRDRVHCFVFGTRLTNISRQLRQRDVDLALAKVGERVAGLVRRHAHRPLPARVQPGLVAPRAGAGCGGAADHRRARPRRRRRPRARDRAPAQELPPADLAEPAAALRGLRADRHRARARSSSTSTISGRCTTWRAWPQLTEALGRLRPAPRGGHLQLARAGAAPQRPRPTRARPRTGRCARPARAGTGAPCNKVCCRARGPTPSAAAARAAVPAPAPCWSRAAPPRSPGPSRRPAPRTAGSGTG